LAHLAMALTMGVAQDLGGTQPYIPVGSMLAASARARRAVDMLSRGASYQQAAAATGLTESRIRKIEGEWRREQMALRQGRLQLD
jgi:Mor family transcriptional regulator